ncbi:endonuclease/exonuclease/phosphatase family protein [Sinomicrobium weinanense]|uniref:Endonuclease/exonuclease/phosphatase family protein n=1 Tax=Sinomicrobium weinanense TaxID=2842200 RepID=A0A926JR08_9FLAO|nr:endonuclease/exonuclease/phosphatase family protein [Sinomicrobium weinanense]MBC9795702.1 endonuclease/exonuclease/phosphatase family protein [Sinomicrobium weinanense]MBU3125265.1 endonuclease/exonuclease/phosphatase family protein [Sinomicrobium weinanense]
MGFPEITATVLASVFIISTLASLVKRDNWWIRVFDFPRLQLFILGLIALPTCLGGFNFDSLFPYILTGLLLICLIYQACKILPYTPFYRKEVIRFKGKEDDTNRISILVSNVLTPNRKAGKLLYLIQKKKPNIVLTLESDSWWQEQLDALGKDYPYTVKIPLDNLYGMHLYSNLELEDTRVMYLVKDDIPSIESYVKLPSGKKVKIYCLHPMPPSPTEDDTSTDRDAELLLVGKKVSAKEESVLVFGDLNDVAWSYTTILFRKISGLMDPRIGRGMFSTFHAGYFFLRWPLDHLFHSNDFMLNRIERLPGIGSDHFPIYGDLQYKPIAEKVQKEPEADSEDEKLAREKIDRAKPIRKTVKNV